MKTDARTRLREVRPELGKTDQSELVRRQLARRLRETRKARGLTQAEVAERSGIPQPQIAVMEAPRGSMPRVDTLRRYMKACRTPIYIGFPDPDDLAPEGAETEQSADLVSSVASCSHYLQAMKAEYESATSVNHILSKLENLVQIFDRIKSANLEGKLLQAHSLASEDPARILSEAREEMRRISQAQEHFLKAQGENFVFSHQDWPTSIRLHASRVEMMDLVSMEIVDSIQLTEEDAQDAEKMETWRGDSMQADGDT